MALHHSNKILIALQYWSGDRTRALKLAKYLADLEPAHSDLADIVLVNRFDCPQDSPATLAALSRKFNVYSYKSPHRGVGWPDGCNGLWFGTVEWAYTMMADKKIPHYKAIFTCEADGAPVHQDWIARMSTAWDVSQQGASRVYMAGALVSYPGVYEHINGNCLVSGDGPFLHWVTRVVAGMRAGVGWDYGLRDEFRRWGWANVPGIISAYNTPHFTPEQFAHFRAQELIWIHGGKDESLIQYGREFFKV